jgi:hypothetical protein
MRRVVGCLAAAALLVAVGASLAAVGYVERRAATVREQMFTLQHDAAAHGRGVVDDWVSYARRLPWVDELEADLAEERATSRYWLREYEPLAVYADTSREAADVDPQLLMTAAHAAYRATVLDGSSPEAVKRLDRVLELYAEVLKRDPHRFDAAYNFEFVARTRNALALVGRPQARSRRPAIPPAAPSPGRTLHGDPGAVPPALEPQEFKVIVPNPSDERQEQQEAGSGTPRVRKG